MMDDPEGMLSGLDQGFGVLTFDGTQQYFALDGQHRLRAIKDALKEDPNLGKEDICILMVTHYDTSDGKQRTRRLFTNINRNAKQTDASENIALDEDDSFAILTRRLVDEHDFLKQENRVRVILSTTEDGGIKLATNSVPKSDARALTTFTVLYDLLQYLSYDQSSAIRNKTRRPDDATLDTAYSTLSARLDDLLKNCGDIRNRLENATSARDVRAPKNAEANGHPFMRPVVQKAVAKTLSEIRQQDLAPWDVLMKRLGEFDWKLGVAPWDAVFSLGGNKMLTSPDNTDLLRELLHAHLAPATKQGITRARKKYKDLLNKTYPVSQETLEARIGDATPAKSDDQIVIPDALSDLPASVLIVPSPDNPVPEIDDDLSELSGDEPDDEE